MTSRMTSRCFDSRERSSMLSCMWCHGSARIPRLDKLPTVRCTHSPTPTLDSRVSRVSRLMCVTHTQNARPKALFSVYVYSIKAVAPSASPSQPQHRLHAQGFACESPRLPQQHRSLCQTLWSPCLSSLWLSPPALSRCETRKGVDERWTHSVCSLQCNQTQWARG